MKRLTPITRIAFGLACLATTLLLAGALVGLVPDVRSAVVEKRRALAETLAINCSIFASQGNSQSIETSLKQTVDRDPDLLSAGVRRPDGTFLLEVGQPGPQAGFQQRGSSGRMKVEVPIVAGKRRWGTVELSFRSLSESGLTGVVKHPLTRLVAFLGGTGFIVFYYYLRKTLQYLDPSKVMPDRVRQTLDTLAEGLMVIDDQERIVHTNEAFSRLVGRAGADLYGRQASQLSWRQMEDREPETYPWSKAVTGPAFETGAKIGLDIEGLGKRTLLVNSSSILDDKGQSRGALVSLDDVTALEASRVELRNMLDKLKRSQNEIQRQNEELERLARLDPLTSCLNRRAFYAQFEVFWNVAERYRKPLSCVMVDVDHFKSVNDQHGHNTGDEVLQAISRILRENGRECDVMCRYGGEEFCLLLPETDIDGACRLAERMRKAIELAEVGEASVTASLGVSALEFGAHDPRQLLDQADQALYAAKRQGRNRVVRWDEVPADVDPDDSEPAQPEREGNREEPGQISFPAVSALMSALSFRDTGTAAHCQRVADLCMVVAKQRLMSPSESYVLETAALLHDIGKIGIRDSILLKPGSLTEDELRIMRTHDQIGAAIVQDAFGSDRLMEVLQCRHAWYGGNPKIPSLPSGRDIPLGARVLAIAEAYDTIVSGSVYPPPRNQEQAFDELRACARSQFDPELVDCFIAEVTARDPCTSDPLGLQSGNVVFSMARRTEELAKALENQDAPAVAIIATRLKLTAANDNAKEIAQAAEHLEQLASEDEDMVELYAAAADLIDLCRSTQRSCLNAGRIGSPRTRGKG
jgi:diguanylate cyclase (GGDEF)-like protein/PAS domain S-box-containing protein